MVARDMAMWRLLALAVAAPLLVTGCAAAVASNQVPPAAAAAREIGPIEPAAAPAAAPAAITISPPDGSTLLPPGARVTVTSAAGPLQNVDLTDSAGHYLPGTFSPDRVSWASGDPLAPGQRFTVDATSLDAAGHTTAQHSAMSTADVPETQRLSIASISPSNGREIGVAYPLIVHFNRPVTNRKAVSDALDVETSPHVEGAWFWMDSSTVDFRPESFWTPGTVVTLHANLAGVSGGENLWGIANRTSAFTVARSQVIMVDLANDQMTVQRGGAVVGSFPVSAGKPGWQTRDGIMTIMEKDTDKTWTNTAIDAPEAYVLHSKYAMRITDSGEFIHDAPWNRGKIGAYNSSHGCVGMLTSDMAELFGESMIGDAVIVTGSGRPFGSVTNRIGDWNVPWAQWIGGNYDLSIR